MPPCSAVSPIATRLRLARLGPKTPTSGDKQLPLGLRGRVSRRRADHITRHCHAPPPIRLPFVRERGRGGPCASADRRGRHPNRSSDHTGAGCQVRRSSAAVPAGADICPAGRPARPIHPGGLGWSGSLVSASLARSRSRATATIGAAVRRRDNGAGARPGHRTNKDRSAMGLCSQRPTLGGDDPPMVAYVYAADRKSERPEAHLGDFAGILQVDGCDGSVAAQRRAQSCATQTAQAGHPDERCRARHARLLVLPQGAPRQAAQHEPHRAAQRRDQAQDRGRRRVGARHAPGMAPRHPLPNKAAITRPVGAILMEQSDEWAVQRAHYMSLETMAPLTDNPIIMLSAEPGT